MTDDLPPRQAGNVLDRRAACAVLLAAALPAAQAQGNGPRRVAWVSIDSAAYGRACVKTRLVSPRLKQLRRGGCAWGDSLKVSSEVR